MKLNSSTKLPSNRAFGLFFALIFFALGGYGYLNSWQLFLSISFSIVAGLFFLCALIAPRILQPLNFAWLKLGFLLGAIVNPIILTILYVGTMLPLGICYRLIGRDSLRLKRSAGSYWVERDNNRKVNFAKQF